MQSVDVNPQALTFSADRLGDAADAQVDAMRAAALTHGQSDSTVNGLASVIAGTSENLVYDGGRGFGDIHTWFDPRVH